MTARHEPVRRSGPRSALERGHRVSARPGERGPPGHGARHASCRARIAGQNPLGARGRSVGPLRWGHPAPGWPRLSQGWVGADAKSLSRAGPAWVAAGQGLAGHRCSCVCWGHAAALLATAMLAPLATAPLPLCSCCGSRPRCGRRRAAGWAPALLGLPGTDPATPAPERPGAWPPPLRTHGPHRLPSLTTAEGPA